MDRSQFPIQIVPALGRAYVTDSEQLTRTRHVLSRTAVMWGMLRDGSPTPRISRVLPHIRELQVPAVADLTQASRIVA
jgi:hypothetical protein